MIAMKSLPLHSQIEAVLFWKAEPLSIKKLSVALGVGESDIREGIETLRRELAERGIVLLEHDGDVTLGTSQRASDIIEKLTKEELSRDLGKAGLETLSIILYQGPISRSDIDYVRGVNSQFILRNLMIRGLIERIDNPEDGRGFLYKPTLALIAHLGVTRVEELRDYDLVREEIKKFKNEKNSETSPSN